MMRVFAHWEHSYTDAARHQTYTIGGGTWREIPDAAAAYILAAHPDKLCDVTEDADPDGHECPNARNAPAWLYQTTVVDPATELDRMMRKVNRMKRKARV